MLSQNLQHLTDTGEVMEAHLPSVRRGPGKMLFPSPPRSLFRFGNERAGQAHDLLVNRRLNGSWIVGE